MNDTPPSLAPRWLVDLLDRSEAQIAAGQTVPLEPVLDRLRASIARMNGRQTRAKPRANHKA